MNVKLLRKVKARILAEPAQFAMSDLYQRAGAINTDVDLPRTSIPNCGTAACIAGWTCSIAREMTPRDVDDGGPFGRDANAAEAKLDIDCGQGARLFFVYGWPKRFAFRWRNCKTLRGRARVAADRIEHFIRSRGRE